MSDSRTQRQAGGAPRTAWWNDAAVRGIFYQVLVVGIVVALGWYLVSNTLENLAARNIATGFGFLNVEAAFGISEGVIDYSPADTYFRALVVGLFNTLKVSILGIILATILGTVVGIARLSSNWLIRTFAAAYVEGLRNIPLLLQLFLWYALITEGLPAVRQAFNPLPGVFLSNRGLRLPTPVYDPAHWLILGAFVVGCVAAWGVARWARLRRERTGQPFPTGWVGAGLIMGLPLLAWLLGGMPTAMNIPELKGFNFAGGYALTPEFSALLFGLVVYTGTFIAEIVRSGILAVSHGQTEAALALGLRRAQVLRLVILPQALRVIIPPLTSQYLNLAKNSSLAVAIGYPDLVSVANKTINQTGQAIEGIAIIMAVYLTISLTISAFMNWYNARVALVSR